MEALSVSDYRKNLAASFDRAEKGEQVLIRRKNEENESLKVELSALSSIVMTGISGRRSSLSGRYAKGYTIWESRQIYI